MRLFSRTLIALLISGTAAIANAALIQVYQDGGSLLNIGDADALIAAGSPIATANNDIINYWDGENPGSATHFGGDVLFPGDPKTDFAVRVTGVFAADPGVVGDFRIRHDDGVRMTINGVSVEVPGLVNDTDSFINGLVLGALNTIEIVFFEHGGGAHLELSARRAAEPGPWFLLRVDNPVPEPGTISLIGLGLLGLGLARRKRS